MLLYKELVEVSKMLTIKNRHYTVEDVVEVHYL